MDSWEHVLDLQRQVARLGMQVTETQLARVRMFAEEAGPEAHHILMRHGPTGLEENNVQNELVAEAAYDFLDDACLNGSQQDQLLDLLGNDG